ncbi:hypothetical protein P152DRAFT_476872 [Eremomyces bilateralis CBS 781.70]|uniref:F-box domain-containing protein n=1 Tax=Eremomyces bilateralis CBS 781.70 TaxID=1392243 RepID=A0A6G1FT40_9PEZI|nr:uncharacterized protein P152DRAFT_476872 [Eremomyces bilateralis CBS 781.70]KAF1808934.1 hypothetical protein P152DRAFT_476872 [Eremomyces bilateralis CBS 781.70]
MDQTEAELERFRQQWKKEVSARKDHRQSTDAGTSGQAPRSQDAGSTSKSGLPPPHVPAGAARNPYEGWDEVQPHSYHDIEQVSRQRALESSSHPEGLGNPPKSALEHYEEAVTRETQGNLGDSVNLYRKAFRLDSSVHEIYKKKHFPPAAKQNAAERQPTKGSSSQEAERQDPLQALPRPIADLIQEYSHAEISPEAPPTELSPPPPCPMAFLPEELLVEILGHLAISDVASFARAAQVCKRLAYLVTTEETIWKRVCEGDKFGFAAMHYRYVCTIRGNPIVESVLDPTSVEGLTTAHAGLSITDPSTTKIPISLSPSYPTYRHMFRTRPRIRFNGCYISTVNYSRPGGNITSQVTWNSPVLIVTYYRYLRFYRDGTVISLLTTSEPTEVIPVLHEGYLQSKNERNRRLREQLSAATEGVGPDQESHPSSKVMKHALRGRWRLSDPITEGEGDVHIETEGAVAKYTFKMQFALSSAGRGVRNNKLTWKGFWSYNTLTDDWGEFGLKNDKSYWWSRVKSWDVGS